MLERGNTWMKIALLTTDNRQHYRDYTQPVPYFGTAPEALLEGFAGLAEAEVHVISCLRQAVVSPAKIRENIYYHSAIVPKSGWMMTAYMGCSRAARHIIRRINPDIVHGQGTERDCALNAVRSGFPNVLTIHGNMAELARLFRVRTGSFHWLVARLEDRTLRRTAGVFCNSEYTENLVRGRASRIWRVPNALRERFFSQAKKERRTDRPILLNIGEVCPRKRQVELLNVAADLQRQGHQFELRFVGHCEPLNAYGREFMETLQPLAQQGVASFVGLKPVNELIAILDQAAALVHFPSEEAFGLVVAEALTRGVKLFGSRVGGIVDIARGVADAELLEPEDWSGLKSRLGAWLKAGAPSSVQGVDLMKSRYHPRVIATRHLEIYREVLNAKN